LANPNLETREVDLISAAAVACPQPVYQQLVAKCPFARQTLLGNAVLSRYEDVLFALRHPEIFSSEMEMHMALGTERPMIPQQIDPPAQTKYRKILDPRFSKKRMQEIEPAVRRHANELIDSFYARGECEFDRDFAIPLPATAFLSLMGLPQSELGRFLRIKDMIIRPQTLLENPTLEAGTALRKQAGREIYEFFGDVIELRKREPGSDMISYLLETEIDGQRLTREEILDVSFLLILAGLDTVTATLGCNIAYLAANPAQRRRIVQEPSTIPAAVEELLRWETPVMAVPRVLKQEIEMHGVKIAKGEMVTLLIGASNVDGAQFEDPERVDFDRERNKHLAFGGGPHRCLGSHLARMELEVALEVWHQRIPDYRVKPGETPRYSPGIREVQYLPIVWEPR
jgi:cytochrome P450